MRSPTRVMAAVVSSDINRSLNYRFSLVNPRSLAWLFRYGNPKRMAKTDERMELPTLRERVQAAIDMAGIGRPQIADRLGVTPQAIVKWLHGGGIGDDKLQGLARLAGLDFLALKYGIPKLAPATDQQVPSPPDTLARVQAIEILDALPQPQRELWLSLGHLLVEKFAPRGPANPYPKR